MNSKLRSANRVDQPARPGVAGVRAGPCHASVARAAARWVSVIGKVSFVSLMGAMTFAWPALAQTPGVVPGATPPSAAPSPAPSNPSTPSPQAQPQSQSNGAVDPRVSMALDRIEAADRELTSLGAALRLIRRFPAIQGGGQQTQYGTISFVVQPAAGPAQTGAAQPAAAQPGVAPPAPLRKFAIKFETRDIPDAAGQMRRESDPQDFIFDGTWLLERRHNDKFFARRRMLAPGAGRDPLKIGEGPFPLPIGQRKADMLERFDVTIVDVMDSAPDNPRLREVLKGCTQLRLLPRVETLGAKDFREIRLWFREPDALPIFAQTINRDDSSAEVFLVNVKRNEPVAPGSFDTTPPADAEGWKGDVIDQVPNSP